MYPRLITPVRRERPAAAPRHPTDITFCCPRTALHCILFDDLLVLLQRQDDRYFLKYQASGVTPGDMVPPFVELDTLIVRPVATGQKVLR